MDSCQITSRTIQRLLQLVGGKITKLIYSLNQVCFMHHTLNYLYYCTYAFSHLVVIITLTNYSLCVSVCVCVCACMSVTLVCGTRQSLELWIGITKCIQITNNCIFLSYTHIHNINTHSYYCLALLILVALPYIVQL